MTHTGQQQEVIQMHMSLVITPTNSTYRLFNTGQCKLLEYWLWHTWLIFFIASFLLHSIGLFTSQFNWGGVKNCSRKSMSFRCTNIKMNHAVGHKLDNPKEKHFSQWWWNYVSIWGGLNVLFFFLQLYHTQGMSPDEKVTITTPTNSTFQIFNTGQCLC